MQSVRPSPASWQRERRRCEGDLRRSIQADLRGPVRPPSRDRLSGPTSTTDRVGSSMRWMPHPLLPVDWPTKADMAKRNAAQLHLLKSGLLRLAAEEQSLQRRRGGPVAKNRSGAASRRQLGWGRRFPFFVFFPFVRTQPEAASRTVLLSGAS
eukprot:136669-Pyramimonas_sp.AAC.1